MPSEDDRYSDVALMGRWFWLVFGWPLVTAAAVQHFVREEVSARRDARKMRQ